MHCLKVFWSNLLEAFKFEILFKIICLIIILPIIKFIIDKYLWINGYNISFKLDIENPIIRINTAFKGCSSLEKISVLPRIYHN